MVKSKICHDGFFVLRLPSLPYNSVVNLTSLEQTNRALEKWLAMDLVKEALYLASPSLSDRIDHVFHPAFKGKELSNNELKQQKKNKLKLERTLLKYMIRMSTRPTPFGLFAGVSLGCITEQTRLTPQLLTRDRRKSRLDFNFLVKSRDEMIRNHSRLTRLKFEPNPSLYRVAQQYRYIESYQKKGLNGYRLSSIDIDKYVQFIMACAQDRLSLAVIKSSFVDNFPHFDEDEVDQYISQLIRESVLLPLIPLPLTGESPGTGFISTLRQIGEDETHDLLVEACEKLSDIDTKREGKKEDYLKICESLKPISDSVSEDTLFQVDTYRAMSESEISHLNIDQLIEKILLLSVSSDSFPNPFTEFINGFNTRFEGQFIPLERILDEETGLGFSHETGYDAPLLENLAIAKPDNSINLIKVTSVLDKVISQKLSMPGELRDNVLKLSSESIKSSLDTPINEAKLPASFAAMISLFDDENGDPILKLNGCYGPSAANLLGRFCHLDQDLKNKVMSHLEKEQAHSPDVVFAEILHMPEGRPGNVISRPHLRQYEIVFMADSTLDEKYQIPLKDLYVWVEEGKVKLWSKRLRKQVIPRLSCAHNYTYGSLSAYRFLNMIQHQYPMAPNFTLPDFLSDSATVPRIMLDDLILSERMWRVPRRELEELKDGPNVNLEKLGRLRRKFELEDKVNFSIDDNVLTLDLANPVMLDILLAETRDQDTITLSEALIAKLSTPVKNSKRENYANEVIVPFFNKGADLYMHYHDNPEVVVASEKSKRRYPPGSEWLSLKVYSGNSELESLLVDKLFPLIRNFQPSLTKWFFIRYADPDWHLRLRFHGNKADLWGRLLPAINELLEPMVENEQLHKVEVSTYEREVERYGGPKAIAMAEKLFMLDSEIVVETIQLDLQEENDLRWRMALLVCDYYLSKFDYSNSQKLELLTQLRSSWGVEFSETKLLRRNLGKKYNKVHDTIIHDLNFESGLNRQVNDDVHFQLHSTFSAWRKRASPLHNQIRNLFLKESKLSCSKDTFISSVLHMHNNRVFKAYGREHELVIYDFLRRYYLTQEKRRGYKETVNNFV